MAYWIKVNYDRNEYVVDLDRVSGFACAPSGGKITFWFPNSSIPIIITQQSNPDAYQTVQNYIEQISTQLLASSWLKIIYDRHEYIIDLNRISTFCHSSNGRVTFWLPDNSLPVIVNKQSDPDGYRQVLEYIERHTGHSL